MTETLALTNYEDAVKIAQEIENVLNTIHLSELGGATGKARLGLLLLKVRSNEYWRLLENADGEKFNSFGQYLKSLYDSYDLRRTQLYQIIRVSEKLLPILNEEQIVKMGTTKANELARLVKITGRTPSAQLIETALNEKTGVYEIREAVFNEMHVKQTEDKGKYWDWGGCYVTDDERAEIEQAFDTARRIDPVIPQDWPVWMQRKEIMLRMCREFFGTYGPEVNSAQL